MIRSGIAGAFLALGLAASPAWAEVTDVAAHGFAVHLSAEVSAEPMTVWAELLAPAKWWDKAHTWSQDAAGLYIDPQASGCFCELLPRDPALPEATRRGSVEHMHVIHADPGKLLVMAGELGPLQREAAVGKLTIALAPRAGGGTAISWDYAVGGYLGMKSEGIAPAVDKVLGQQLKRLAERLNAQGETPAAK